LLFIWMFAICFLLSYIHCHTVQCWCRFWRRRSSCALLLWSLSWAVWML